MTRLAALVLLAACSSAEPTLEVDAGPGEPDATPGPIALEPGTYAIDWTCIDGCGPLAFPPATYNRLDVSEGLALRWYTEGAVNELEVASAAADSLCVVSEALVYSEGATAPIEICPADDGPEADVTFTADYGPMPVRTHRLKATLLPPG